MNTPRPHDALRAVAIQSSARLTKLQLGKLPGKVVWGIGASVIMTQGGLTDSNAQSETGVGADFSVSIICSGAASQLGMGKPVTLRAQIQSTREGEQGGSVADGQQTYQWYKDGVEIRGANKSSFFMAKALQATAGTYSVQVKSATGASSAETVVAVRNPFAELYGSTGQMLAELQLTPKGASEPQKALLTFTLTRNGGVSALLRVNGESYPLRSSFDSSWQAAWSLPSTVTERSLSLSVNTPDLSSAPELVVAVDGTQSSAQCVGCGPFDVATQYVDTYAFGEFGECWGGYLSASTLPSTGRILICSATPNGEKFVGSTFLAPDTTGELPTATFLVSSGPSASVYSKLQFSPTSGPRGSGRKWSGSSERVPVFKMGTASSSSMSWSLASAGGIFTTATKTDILRDSDFSVSFPNLFELAVTTSSGEAANAGTFKVQGLKLVRVAASASDIRGRSELQVNPKTGMLFGTAITTGTDGGAKTQTFTGVFLGLNGGIGLTNKGNTVRLAVKEVPYDYTKYTGASVSLGTSLTVNNTLTLSGSNVLIAGTLVANSGTLGNSGLNLIANGTIGGLTKTGSGNLTLVSNNAYNGTLSANGGTTVNTTLNLVANGTIGASSLTTSGTLTLVSNSIYSGALSPNSGTIIAGTLGTAFTREGGTLMFATNSANSGALSITNGTLVLGTLGTITLTNGATTSLGPQSLTFTAGTLWTGSLSGSASSPNNPPATNP